MRSAFLTVILLCVASLSAFPQAADLFAGDARLAVRVHVHAAGVGIPEVLKQIGRRAGVSLRAAPSASDDRVVLYSDSRSAAEILRALARFFGFAWEREGEPGRYRYTLSQPAASRDAERLERQATLQKFADRILSELKRVAEIASWTEQRRMARRAELEAKLDVPSRFADSEWCILQQWESASGAWIAATGIICAMPRSELVALLDHGRAEYALPAEAGERELPPAVAEAVKAFMRRASGPRSGRGFGVQSAIRPAAGGEEMNYAALRFEARQQQWPSLQVMAMAGYRTSSRSSSQGRGFMLPIALSPTTAPKADRPLPDTPAALALPVSLDLAPFPNPVPRALPRPALAELFESLESLVPFDLICDAFYTTTPQYGPVNDLPLAKALDVVAGRYGHTWKVEDGFVQFRSREFGWDHGNDPRDRVLARWTNPTPGDALDRLAELASLPPGLFETTLDLLSRSGWWEASNVRQDRNALALWSALQPAQRQAAERPEGVSYSELTAEQQRLFELASVERLPHQRGGDAVQHKLWTPAQLQHAALKVTVRTAKQWGFREGSNWATYTAASREEAFEKLKRGRANVTLERVEPVIQTTVMFDFGGPFPNDRVHYLNLPLEWPSP